MHQLDVLLEFAPVAMAMFDGEMRYIWATRRWIDDFNIEAPVARRSHYEIFPEIPERWKQIHHRVLSGESLRAEEDRFERVDGTVLWLRWEIVPWRREDGSVGGVVIRSEDITEKKTVQRRLNETQARLQAVMDAALVGISYADDPHCRHINGNKALWKQFESGPQANLSASAPEPDAEGRGIRYYIDRREIADSELPLQRAISEQREIPPMELEIVLPSGRRWYALASAAPVLDENNEPRGGVAVTVDITDRLRMEQALREADRRKDEFLAILAHELRNPLAPLRNALCVLTQSDTSPRDAALFAMMQRQVDNLVRLVDDLMEVSRIKRGKIELHKTRVNLHDALRQAVETSAPAIETKGHDLRLFLGDEPLEFEGDPTRLVQIFANLLNNAAKFTPHGGQIQIVASREGEDVVVSVCDNGCGLRKEMLSGIFDLFAQDETNGRPHDGIGAGLALARGLVELHGGRIEALSAGEGCGSQFTVRLPVLPRAYASGKKEPPAIGDTSVNRVLVVDDNADAADTLGVLLEALSQEVRVVYGGEAALAEAASFRPSLAFIDIGMPGMDGYETARRMRQLPEGRAMALFAVSGWGREEDKIRCVEAGFDGHLTKPASVELLRACLSGAASPG